MESFAALVNHTTAWCTKQYFDRSASAAPDTACSATCCSAIGSFTSLRLCVVGCDFVPHGACAELPTTQRRRYGVVFLGSVFAVCFRDFAEC